MKLTINGQEKRFTAPLNIEDCLMQEGYQNMTVAVARNNGFVPKTAYKDTLLEEGDIIDIVAPMQGG